MNNKIFVDSSIFIENFKGNNIAREILQESIDKFDICINGIVFSEIIFKLMILKSGKSALTIKSQKLIPSIVKNLDDYSNLLLLFNVLEENKEILRTSFQFMQKYNLLTNDALILATCKYYGITKLASLDKDFESIAANENIQLINNPKDIE